MSDCTLKNIHFIIAQLFFVMTLGGLFFRKRRFRNYETILVVQIGADNIFH
jgi:hypothetical protein